MAKDTQLFFNVPEIFNGDQQRFRYISARIYIYTEKRAFMF